MGQSPSAPSSPRDTSLPDLLGRQILTSALTTISHKLWKKTQTHHTFLVCGGVVSVLLFSSRPTTRDLNLLTISDLDTKTRNVLINSIQKCSQKYKISPEWMNNDMEKGADEETLALVVTRSYDQRAVVYTSEGLTLLAVDFVYALKSKLSRYSLAKEQGGQNPTEMVDMVEIARRLVMVENQGRSLTKGYMERFYAKLFFSQESWEQLSQTYETRYGERGILVELDYQ